MARTTNRVLSGAKAPGGRRSISRYAAAGIELAIALSLFASFSYSAQGSTDSVLRKLVTEAGNPAVFYGEPERRDSLISLLADCKKEGLEELIDLLDTPWAIHFEVLRLALEKKGPKAREAIIRRIKEKKTQPGIPALLTVFEKMGRPGDEKYLVRALKSKDLSSQICAARCLASFGSFAKSYKLLAPFLTSSHPQVRLAAVWALGQIYGRDPEPRLAGQAVKKIRLLLADPHPLVRFSAEEAVAAIQGSDKEVPKPLYPLP
jgi:HEAT repeat protein